jgi:hypothetical protein
VENSPYPLDDRGHHIQTSSDLQEKYARRRGSLLLYSLQAKLNNKVFGESALVIAEPKLEYVILKDGKGSPIIAYPEDKIEFPEDAVIGIVDVRSNVPDPAVFLITMSGKSIRWQPSEFAGIDGALLSESETPLDIVRSGKSIGRIWLKKGRELRVSSGPNRNTVTPATVRY